MDPDNLIFIDYLPSLEPPPSSPSTSNQSIDSDDYFIKLNQAWEMEVKKRKAAINWLTYMEQKWEKYSGIGKVIPGFSAKSFVMKPSIQPIQPCC